MSNTRAAIRYAKAMLDLAVEKKTADKVEKDMQEVKATIAASGELRQLLDSPVVKTELKQKTLLEIFKKNEKITANLIETLAHNKRIALLGEVANQYIGLYEKMKGEDVAHVTTAVPLTPDMEKKVLAQVKKITKNKVTLENDIDESIIGGFILRVGDLQYDASVANKLNKLKREFTNSL
ncbi:ATP synthase F1 subunit delta [Allomuricauda sp. SCSIO 65647]|uniref:ATP synthase F1 subunit delta n=1 Tax=Allomuricauda sp. SCSIO 65647 TaxID=2908843 RepID=UPI001F27FEAC|nr:ATP synthase F1 subunit delta [Muricauda sp. SCSIO 65647]UJH69013.1 ATP synthase F1 subunit delta [Muricauda sp. SCSIO 65647]